MSSTTLLYDTCETNMKLNESRNILDWVLDVHRHENEKKCHHKLGLVGGSEVYEAKRNLVDLESELRGQNHIYSKCPEDKHHLENNGISKPFVNVDQHYCKGAKKVKTQFKKMEDCQMLDFRNVRMDGCPNV